MAGFRKAVKESSNLRLALFGPAGAGKTFTSLGVASGMVRARPGGNGRVAVIDTERGSASKYADRFDFDSCDLDRPDIEAYINALGEAGRAGYPVVVIDSLSHGWQELLEEINAVSAKMGNNTWAAWSKGTPKQRRFVDAILKYPGHVIATMRSRTAWEVGDDSRGRKAPVRIGLAPEQGKGIEYEFDLLGEVDVAHNLTIIKDRTGKYQDQSIARAGAEFGADLIAWLTGSASAVASRQAPAPTFTAFVGEFIDRGELDNIEVFQVLVNRAAQEGEGEPPPEDATPKEIGKAARAVWLRDPERARRWVEEAEGVKAGHSIGDDEDDVPAGDDDDQADDEDAELDAMAARDGPAPSRSDRLADELGD